MPLVEHLQPVQFGDRGTGGRAQFARHLSSIRTRFLAGAQRRNQAAIRKGAQTRAQTGAAPVMQNMDTYTSLLTSYIALQECLLADSDNELDERIDDPKYQDLRATAAEVVPSKAKAAAHIRAGLQASALGDDHRAERHFKVAAGYEAKHQARNTPEGFKDYVKRKKLQLHKLGKLGKKAALATIKP